MGKQAHREQQIIEFVNDFEDVAIATWVLTVETQATACYLLLRQESPLHTVAFEMLERLREVAALLDPTRVQSGVKATIHHMLLLTGIFEHRAVTRLQLLSEWEDCTCTADPYVKHDIELFRRRTLGVPSTVAYLYQESSRFGLPPRVVNSHLNPTGVSPVLKKPSYVVGVIDTEHLARLTHEEKENIRCWQVRNNTIPRATDTLLD